jgi:hypothetical protein
MTTYKLYKTPNNKNAIAGQLDSGKTVSFEVDEANTDYQEYLKWLDEGNEPLPADE